jgi:hypothetical protein
MSLDSIPEGLFILAPIILLLVVGAVIALRSGVHDLSAGQGYLQIAGNLSRMLLRVACYVAILLTLQSLIGLRPSLGW